MYFGILEANDGSIWFGALDGVHRYDGNTIADFKDKAFRNNVHIYRQSDSDIITGHSLQSQSGRFYKRKRKTYAFLFLLILYLFPLAPSTGGPLPLWIRSSC